MPVSFILRVGCFNIQRTIPALTGETEVIFDDLIFEAVDSVNLDPPPRVQIVPIAWSSIVEFTSQQMKLAKIEVDAMDDKTLLNHFDEEQMKI